MTTAAAPAPFVASAAAGATPAPAATGLRRAAAATRSPRRLPRWLKRGLRTWASAARWWAGEPRRRWRPRAEPLLEAFVAEVEAEEAASQARHERRCGWFDSSQDLREGLAVSEHEARDAVCAQLPVVAWVQLQLSGWRPQLAPEEAGLAAG
ncbi:MAG: hypothetical protein JNL85_15670 [Rubrivivax sp.]|nr:hypothetical protein [Rubrivivax sp.]